jgi:hypothetical protein
MNHHEKLRMRTRQQGAPTRDTSRDSSQYFFFYVFFTFTNINCYFLYYSDQQLRNGPGDASRRVITSIVASNDDNWGMWCVSGLQENEDEGAGARDRDTSRLSSRRLWYVFFSTFTNKSTYKEIDYTCPATSKRARWRVKTRHHLHSGIQWRQLGHAMRLGPARERGRGQQGLETITHSTSQAGASGTSFFLFFSTFTNIDYTCTAITTNVAPDYDDDWGSRCISGPRCVFLFFY